MSASSRRDDWRRRAAAYLSGQQDALEVVIPDVRWLDALALAAAERVADKAGNPDPIPRRSAVGWTEPRWVQTRMNAWQLQPLDPRLAEWCWPVDLIEEWPDDHD